MSHMYAETLIVPDISCSHCVSRVDKALRTLAGVQAVSVDLASKQVTVQFDTNVTSLEAIKAVLDNIGYPASSVG